MESCSAEKLTCLVAWQIVVLSSKGYLHSDLRATLRPSWTPLLDQLTAAQEHPFTLEELFTSKASS